MCGEVTIACSSSFVVEFLQFYLLYTWRSHQSWLTDWLTKSVKTNQLRKEKISATHQSHTIYLIKETELNSIDQSNVTIKSYKKKTFVQISIVIVYPFQSKNKHLQK